MAIRTKGKSIDNIIYVDEIAGGNIQLKYNIARVYRNGKLLWEYANSNFFTADNCIIVTSDGYVLNGRKTD